MAAARPMPINIRTTQLLKAKLIMAIPGTVNALSIFLDCLFFPTYLDSYLCFSFPGYH